MKHHIYAQYKHVRIRPVLESDIESLRQWRNDPRINAFLRKIGQITPELQKVWWDKGLADPTSAMFTIEETETLHRPVGSICVYDISGDTAEIGKLIVGDFEARGKKVGFYALVMAIYAAFTELGINTLFGEVHEDNMPSYINAMRAGLINTGEKTFIHGISELKLILPKEHFMQTHDFLNEIDIRTAEEE